MAGMGVKRAEGQAEGLPSPEGSKEQPWLDAVL